jgi:hypothetical protein
MQDASNVHSLTLDQSSKARRGIDAKGRQKLGPLRPSDLGLCVFQEALTVALRDRPGFTNPLST